MSRFRMLLRFITIGGVLGLVAGVIGSIKIVNSRYNYNTQWSDLQYEIPTVFYFIGVGIFFGALFFVIAMVIKSKMITNFFKGKF